MVKHKKNILTKGDFVKKVVLLFDVHLTEKVPKQYEVVKKFIKGFIPDIVVLGGDFMDCSSLSHWNQNKKREMEGKRFAKECQVANKELDFLQEYSFKQVYLKGNHEDWVDQYVDAHPELEGLIDLESNLKLKERFIEVVDVNKLYRLGNLYITHGMYTNLYHAAKHLNRLGCNVVYGHTHNIQSAMMNMRMQKPIQATAIGCLCDHSPSYLKGKPANWINGFAVVYLQDNGDFNLYPVNIIKNKFIFEGKLYS